MHKKDMHYQFIVFVGIHVDCSLYKLVHGDVYLHWNKLLAIGESTIHVVLQEFLFVINIACKNQIQWCEGEDWVEIVVGFEKNCGLPSIHGTIDVIHIHIEKPNGPFARDYYSFKSNTFNIQLQTMVDHWGQFKNVFVGMPRLMNDVHNLGISSLYRKVVNGELLRLNPGMDQEIRPYILRDKWYLLLSWFMILHKQIGNVHHIALEVLFNK